MKKALFILCTVLSQLCSGQDFRIIYDLNGCPPNPFLGAPVIYSYIGIGTINAGTTFDYWSGWYDGTVNPLYPIGNNLWEICVDPFTFQDNNGQTPPITATIFNITVYFHDAAGGIITGTCGGGFLQINNPMTGAVSLNPTIVNGFKNCFVGIKEESATSNFISCDQNPMSTSTVFNYSTITRGKITLEIFNLLGKKVKTLVNEKQPAGLHSVKWNATNDNGAALANGYYFYSLKVEDKIIKANKIVIAR